MFGTIANSPSATFATLAGLDPVTLTGTLGGAWGEIDFGADARVTRCSATTRLCAQVERRRRDRGEIRLLSRRLVSAGAPIAPALTQTYGSDPAADRRPRSSSARLDRCPPRFHCRCSTNRGASTGNLPRVRADSARRAPQTGGEPSRSYRRPPPTRRAPVETASTRRTSVSAPRKFSRSILI